MKKTIIFTLVVALMLSVFAVSAFATESVDSPSADISVDSSLDGSVESDEASENSASVDTSDDTSDDTNDDTSEDTSLGSSEESSVDKYEGLGRTDKMLLSLKHMAVGMLGVLIVLSLIACVVFILNKAFKPR